MTVAATVAGAISMLAQFGFFFGGGRDRDNPMGPIGVLLAVIFAPLAAVLIQMTISRTREYSADRLGAEISGNPLALASALRKISAYARRIPMPSAERNPASAPLFIINPLSGQRMDNLFSTHPNVENRIRALEAMAGDDRAAGRRPRPSPIPTRRGAAGERARASPPAGRRRRWSPACSSAGAASPTRPRRRTGRWRRWRRPSGRGRRRWPPATLRHLGRIDARARPASSTRPPPPAALNALRLAVAEMHLDGVPAHAAVDGAVRLARAGARARQLAGPRQRRGAAGGRRRRRRSGRRRPRPGCPAGSPAPVAAAWGAGGGGGDRGGAPARRRRSTSRLKRPDGGRRAGPRRSAPSGCRPAACGSPAGRRSPALPGYAEGAWWVQDAAAALPARLLGAARRAARRSTSAPRPAARRCSSPPPAPR